MLIIIENIIILSPLVRLHKNASTDITTYRLLSAYGGKITLLNIKNSIIIR